MKPSFVYFLLVCTIMLITVSCKKDDVLQKKGVGKIVQGNILGVNGPISGTVNQELVFNLMWQNTDGTARVEHLIDSSLRNVNVIKLFALTHAIDTAIVPSKIPSTITYTFKASSPGTYFLKFYKADNADKTAIIDTVVIR
jgi:hypothetical protein